MPADTTSPVDTRAARRAQGPLTLPSIDREASGRAAPCGGIESAIDVIDVIALPATIIATATP